MRRRNSLPTVVLTFLLYAGLNQIVFLLFWMAVFYIMQFAFVFAVAEGLVINLGR